MPSVENKVPDVIRKEFNKVFNRAYLNLKENLCGSDFSRKIQTYRYFMDNPDKQVEQKSWAEFKVMMKEIFKTLQQLVRFELEAKAQTDGKDPGIYSDLVADIPNFFYPSDEYLKRERSETNMGCPVCQERLVFKKRSNYETLVEHVSDPNGYVFKKDGYGCQNESCDACKNGLIWLGDGEGPFGYFGNDINYIGNNENPFRTWHRAQKAMERKRYTLFRNKYFGLNLEIRSYKASEDGKRSWIRWSFKFQPLIRSNGGLAYYHSGIGMLFFCLKGYWKPFFNKNRSEALAEGIKSLSHDKRWWKRASLFIARFVWPSDYRAACRTEE